MENVTKLDNALYTSIYNTSKYDYAKLESPVTLWNKIKKDNEVLKEAVKLTKNRWNEIKVKGTAIAEQILLNYTEFDNEVYQTLIDNIYKYPSVARTYLDGNSNGAYSFLLLSFCNPNLKLNEEQKAFAVKEALNEENPNILCPHGFDAFDIRYWILRSSNWTEEEKQILIKNFWHNDDEYSESLNYWEWEIINKSDGILEIDNIYYYTYEDVLDLIKDKKHTDDLWTDITFCHLAHKLRPTNYEIEPKLTLKN